MAAGGGSVAVAADPDAAVFGFRGSAPDAVEAFRKDFAPDEVSLTDVQRGEPERVAWLFDHLTEEAEAIAREARRLRTRTGTTWGQMAIVVRRYGGAVRAVRRAFERGGVPYVVVGENRPLPAEPALRPMLDLVRAALRPAEEDDLLPGLLGSPVVGLDPYDVRALRREARLRDRTLTDVLMAPPGDLPDHVRAALDDLRALIDDIRDRDARGTRPDDLFFMLWQRLAMFRDLVEHGDHEALDAIAAFWRAVERFTERRRGNASFEEFLEALEGVEFGPEPWNMPEERRPDAVRIMTAHHSVGAEFETVFVAGCVEGEFPDPRAPRPMLDIRDLLAPTEPFARLQARLAEEKRLFGVATSRARTRLVLTAARESSQREAQQPSPLVPAAGLTWERPEPGIDALTRAEAAAAARRVLRASMPGTPAQREEAFDLLTRLPGVDPGTWWYEREWTDTGRPMFDGDELKTSYSRLSVYDNCGLAYLYQVELGLDPETSHAMLVGTWIHDIVDKAASGEIECTEEALLAALEDRWDPTIFEGPAIEDRRKRDCVDMLQAWLACDGDMKVLATEVGFAFPVQGALVRGRIDALVRIASSMVRVIDYKTARWAKREYELEEDLQLAIYNLAMHRDPELAKFGTPKRLELAYLGTAWRKGFKRPGIDPTKQPDYEARTEQTVNDYVAGIRAEKFAPDPEAECRFCSFKTLCPVWPQGDEVPL
jgi:ATP-dependent exoDNAse (exonuclease V) beta subunit